VGTLNYIYIGISINISRIYAHHVCYLFATYLIKKRWNIFPEWRMWNINPLCYGRIYASGKSYRCELWAHICVC